MDRFSVDAARVADLPPPPEDSDIAPPPTEATAPTTAHWQAVVAAFGVVLLGWLIAANLLDDGNFGARRAAGPVAGLTIFAVFFVAAQGIERLLEPLTLLLPPAGLDREEKAARADDAVAAATRTYVKVTEHANRDNKEAHRSALRAAEISLRQAAQAQAAARVRKSDLSVLIWAVATVVGVLASASLKLYLLRTVGIAQPPRTLEILATGLILGAGTKPLHDLTKLLEARKETAQDRAAATGDAAA
jgi:hypothetical protein